MKNILILWMLAIISTPLWSAVPIITVPEISSTLEIELYEDSQGLFAMKLMEYYKMAVILETQLKILGVEAKNKAKQPVFEELEDMELNILRKYHKIAKSLEKEVIGAPDSDRQILLEKINELESRMRDTVAIYTIEKGAERNKILDLMVQSLKQVEETNSKNIELVINQNFVNCMDYKTLVSVAGVSKIFFSQGDGKVTNDPGLGLQFSVNLGKMVGFWEGFEIRYEYLAPKFFTNYEELPLMPHYREQWNTNISSVSAGGKIELNKTEKVVQGFNLFLGYFWADGYIYNQGQHRMNIDGGLMSLEYYLGSPGCKYPIEIFGGISVFNSFSKSLVFNTGVAGFEQIDVGKTHLSVNLGLRYNIWRTPF